jgi:hypothetical protein
LLKGVRGTKVSSDLQNTFSRRLIYGLPSPSFVNETAQKQNPVAVKKVAHDTFESQVEKHNFDEGKFEGKVTTNNWAVTRRQRVIRSISFESSIHDIFAPQFSSDTDSRIELQTSSSGIEESLESQESNLTIPEQDTTTNKVKCTSAKHCKLMRKSVNLSLSLPDEV